MKRVIYILVFLTFYANSQNTGKDDDVIIFSDSEFNVNFVTFKKKDIVTEGTVYLFKNFENNALLFATTNKKYKLTNLNYNLLDKSFDIKISKDSIFSINNNYIEHIEINGNFFKKLTIEGDEKFYQILYEDSQKSLIKDHEIRLVAGTFNPLNGVTQPNKYHKSSKYYLLIDGNRTEIKLKKKDILKLFEEKSNEVKDYVKNHNLSYKNEKDVIKIFYHVKNI